MVIGTVASGVGVATTFSLNYVPEYLFYVAATQFTSIKVTVLGDGVICDLDAAGLSSLGKARQKGNLINGYMIPLADGLVTGKTVEIVITNSAAVAITLYGVIKEKGSSYVQTMRQNVLASSGIDFTKFSYLSIANASVTDSVTVIFQDNTLQKYTTPEMGALLCYYQVVAGTASDFAFDNFEQNISKVNFIPLATQTCYIMRYAPIGKLEDAYQV